MQRTTRSTHITIALKYNNNKILPLFTSLSQIRFNVYSLSPYFTAPFAIISQCTPSIDTTDICGRTNISNILHTMSV